MKFLIVAVMLLLAACGAGTTIPTQSPAPPTASPNPTPTIALPTDSPTPTASAEPSPSAVPEKALGVAQSPIFPGAYSARFLPAFSFSIDRQVELDCAQGYECRGEVYVNELDWLGIGFGNAHGAEFNARLIDRVYDPSSPGNVIDAPTDIAGLIESMPGVELLGPATAVTVGGLPAVQLDVQTGPELVQIAPSHEFALPNEHAIRMIMVEAEGHQVALTEEIGSENHTGDFAAALEVLQPIIDSIQWHAVVALGAAGTELFPGMYSTQFEPAFTLVIGKEVDIDCSPDYECRGDISANSATFVDLEFGNVHGSELMFAQLDKVFDPSSPDTQIDPPADFVAWITALPGVTELSEPVAITIGGFPATQLEVASANAQLGPTFGMSRNDTLVIGVTVDGQLVVITEQVGPQNRIGDEEFAFTSLQPIIDSIVWR